MQAPASAVYPCQRSDVSVVEETSGMALGKYRIALVVTMLRILFLFSILRIE